MEQTEFGLKPLVRNRHIGFPGNRVTGDLAIPQLTFCLRTVHPLEAALNRVNSRVAVTPAASLQNNALTVQLSRGLETIHSMGHELGVLVIVRMNRNQTAIGVTE
jgi:hypothetical protein